jgi:hypothetical protein
MQNLSYGETGRLQKRAVAERGEKLDTPRGLGCQWVR